MNLRSSNYVRLGVLGLALALTPLAVPAQAQSNHQGEHNPATASMQNSDMVPGTGMTVAELRDLGYDQQQIAEIRNTDLSQTAGATADRSSESAPVNSDRDRNQDVQRAENKGGSNWGWIGLFGLLGLLGLRRGHKEAVVHEDRDIRRVA